MNNYKGYLRGVNPNYTRKVLQDDDDRYFAYESSTGRFVNNIGQEVKTAKEAIASNEKIDAEYTKAFPPQKMVGAEPVRSMSATEKYDTYFNKKSPKYYANRKGVAVTALDNIRKKPNRARPTTSYAAIKKSEPSPIINFNSGIDELIKHRKKMESIHAETVLAERKFNHRMQKRIDADDDKGLSGLMGGGFDA